MTLSLTSLANAGNSGGDPDQFCNAVTLTGETSSGLAYGDVSTDGTNPDPDGDDSPDERVLTCFSTADVPVELMTFAIE